MYAARVGGVRKRGAYQVPGNCRYNQVVNNHEVYRYPHAGRYLGIYRGDPSLDWTD